MKERPILFSAPMVRAILEGGKTQTRRVAKNHISLADTASETQENLEISGWSLHGDMLVPPCPYGRRGDRLWVRETWAPRTMGFTALDRACKPRYRADNDPKDAPVSTQWGGWKPSIHMPRWASRITLEITGIRVERLQDISEGDANCEGVDSYQPQVLGTTDKRCMGHPATKRDLFCLLWESINGADSWDANPWVWVIEFRKLP